MRRKLAPVADRMPWVAVAVLLAATVLAYSNSFQGAWVFDDHYTVHSAWGVATWANVARELRGGRPVVGLSVLLNNLVSGDETWSYHATNLAIHFAAGLCLLGLVSRVTTRPVGLAVALIWLVHPLQTESVTYLCQRSQALMGAFELAFFYAFARSREGGPHASRWRALSVGAFVLGMCCKAHMVLAPLLVLLYERSVDGISFTTAIRRNRVFYGALAALWALAVAYLIFVLRRRGWDDIGAGGGTPLGYALAQCVVIPHYLRLFFWPDHLCIDYEWPPVQSVSEAIPGALLIAAIVVVTVWATVRRDPWGLLGAWLLIDLAPSSSFIPRPDLAVEHRMYMPLASLVLATVLSARFAWVRLVAPARARRIRHVPAGILAIVVLALAAQTRARNEDYRSEAALWQTTTALRPANARAQYNLGMALKETGDLPGALTAYTRAVEGGREDALVERANLYESSGQLDRALEDLTRALAKEGPLAKVAHFNRGNVNVRLGRCEPAILDYTAVIALDPKQVQALMNRASAYQQLGQDAPAIEDCTRAIALAPDLAVAYVTRATSYGRQGNYWGAWGDVRAARHLGATFPPRFLEELTRLSGHSE